MKSFLMLSIVNLMACGVESIATTEAPQATVSSAVPARSEATPVSAESESVTAAASCFEEWDCRICGTPNRTQNILVEICDDGTETIISAGGRDFSRTSAPHRRRM